MLFYPLDFECNYRLRFHLWLVRHWHFQFAWFWDEKATCLLWLRRGLGLTLCLTMRIALLTTAEKFTEETVGQEGGWRQQVKDLSDLCWGETEPESMCKANGVDLCHALEAHTTGSCLLYLSMKFMCWQHSLSSITSCWCSCCPDSSSTILGQLTVHLGMCFTETVVPVCRWG